MLCKYCELLYSLLPLAPTAPRNFTIETSLTPTVLIASWVAPRQANGVLRNFTVTCNGSREFSVEVPSGDPSVIQTNLTGLMAFTFYECSVMAATGAGTGPSSEIDVAMTAEDGKLSGISSSNILYR